MRRAARVAGNGAWGDGTTDGVAMTVIHGHGHDTTKVLLYKALMNDLLAYHACIAIASIYFTSRY